jgi:hypothetical protein
MQRQNAEEFLQALLETIDDLPPELATRLAHVLKDEQGDRAQAIRRVFEDAAGE